MQKYLVNSTKYKGMISHSVLRDNKVYRKKNSKFYNQPRYDSVEKAIKQFPNTITTLDLKTLDLNEVPSNIVNFVNLKVLNLSFNKLTELPLDECPDFFSNLKIFSFRNNTFDDEKEKNIKKILYQLSENCNCLC